MGNSFMNLDFFTSIAFSTIRVSTPIIYAALGGLISMKAGMTNLALEGTMLTSALIGVIVSAYTQSAFLGFIGAIIGGVFISLVISYMALKLDADLVLTCIAANLMASGGTVFLMFLVCNDKGTTIDLKSLTLPSIHIPIIKDIPILGPIISGHNIMTYFAFICVIIVYYLVYKTPIGLRIRAVGENPKASESVGVDVQRIKIIALVLSGVFAAFGGAYMSMGYISWFARDMIAGRGFIGISAMNLGNATPVGSLIASLIFGAADAIANVLQSLKIPVEFVQMIPYVSTLIGLVIFSIINERKSTQRRATK